MFKYDQDFVAEHMDAAMSFFASIFWRFFLVNFAVFLPTLGVFFLFQLNDFSYLILFFISSINSFIALSISIWMVRNKSYIDKKKGQVTYLNSRCLSDEGISDRSLIVKISLQLFWRSWISTIFLYLIAFILSILLNVNLVDTAPEIIFGVGGFMVGWIWFVLFNSRTTTFIDFKSEAVEG